MGHVADSNFQKVEHEDEKTRLTKVKMFSIEPPPSRTYCQMKNYFTEDPGVIPKTVRLAFHHCMGGCDGCIAFNATLNRGLVWYIQEQGSNSIRKKDWYQIYGELPF